ncbi:helix-turn-helix domain-containing protein [Variovorax sp. J22G73]|uniref:helix-turn-helix domain-containing protein n=1 Tax=unclassified Variovorax TaxID=663243 RepID=UPI0025753FA2|nr:MULTISPECIES: helix-turn-helix domain-containing protein [unclassified Variovorax]MDM0007456.1 helix-turn-helix domain-containing protein [Variovorax sp. J22R203]MDM0100185.1 helix-turn-helix domain-containing protein [Variovorax sp. J22G73]
MSNLVATLKAEISRVARKEVRAEIDSLKKSSAAYRSGIAELRRQVALLENELRRLSKGVQPAVAGAEAGGAATESTKRRFSAARLAAHREKLGISAASYGELVGVSGQTIYHWEQGKARPRAAQLEILAGVRSLSKAQI